MTRSTINTDESYIAYLTEQQISELYQPPTDHQYIPHFYTTRTGLECRRYFCEVCGPLAKSNLKTGSPNVKYTGALQRQLDWIAGTTLPDALTRSHEAMMYYSDHKH
ncbi:hypothetical protein MS3_00010883 [Schistosoma haematobium]|uniref:Uncharacterized protein n=1 Tax=Schistosoma haematobium TaxID=6185 RepID=A0A095CB10_SCHHA|nr:hypothetical protein MS3_00010883 [Schistosoma haematobium]KAH9582503.1 hypothetical protein MS3_00010883 [Schistosoma haematobium]CAH8584486.1 unnamed protein product [Schistosoma bovis]CAH8596381.1 unnamed protein product [Schistosoma haematobium]CAH8603299.1 unnamed protein product [Schistosoma haematobium]